MNAPSLWRMPRYWSYPSLRWIAIAVFVPCTAAAIGLGMFGTGPKAWSGALALYGVGLLYAWGFFFPVGLVLAIDARRLCLPGIQSRIHLSLLLYGVLGIAWPLLMPGVGLGAVAVLALFVATGLTFALMPRYLAVIFALVPSLANAVWSTLHLPGITDPRFERWAALAAVAMLLASAWRWRQLLRAGDTHARGWSSPMVLQLRSGSWGCIGDSRQSTQRPDWLQPGVDLARVGPGAPRKTLRVALGGWYLPQTVGSYARQLLLLLGIVAMPIAAIAILSRAKSSGGADLGATLAGAFVGAFSSLSVMAAPTICILSLLWLGRRWQRTNAELPLLALLPGLGDAADNKRQLLRTALGLPLALHALFALAMVALMLSWHGHAYMLSFMLLAQVGAAMVTCALLLNLFGGRALSPWRVGLVLAATVVLTLASVLLPALALGRHPMAQALPLLPLLPAGWVLFAGAMAWLCRRGWRGLQQQPHPFLAG